ncbi:MAG: hypothetical protein OXT67_04455, partial [Zetaproteobacteria bacterium]|nr:hypothetical protein [Zetaproteobacteria bacterium]
MMRLETIDYSHAKSHAIFQDLADTFNQGPAEQLTEFAFARTGGSAFTRAMYYSQVNPDGLAQLANSPRNVAFLSDCDSRQITPPYGQLCKRKAKNAAVTRKSIVSFDLDFKDWMPEFPTLKKAAKREFALGFASSMH